MSNEAAERLRSMFKGELGAWSRGPAYGLLDAALDTERKATVERIRATIEQASFWDSWLIDVDRDVLTAILDAEAARA